MRARLLVLVLVAACADGDLRDTHDSRLTPATAPQTQTSEANPSTNQQSGLFPEPTVACNLLADHGLPTSGYKIEEGDKWYCFGDLFTSVEGAVVPDEVSYTVTGNPSVVHEITLISEHYVMNPGDEQRTLSRAAKAAETLLRVLGRTTDSAAVLEAFRSGRSGTWPIDGGTVVVEREQYPTGNGYSMYLRIRN